MEAEYQAQITSLARSHAQERYAYDIRVAKVVYDPINTYLQQINNYFDYPYDGASSYIYVGIDYFRKKYVQIRLLHPSNDKDSILTPNKDGSPPISNVGDIITKHNLSDVYADFCSIYNPIYIKRYPTLEKYLRVRDIHLCVFLLESFRISIKDKYPRLYRALCTNKTRKDTDITDKIIFDNEIIPYNNGFPGLPGITYDESTSKGCYTGPKRGGARRTRRKVRKSRKARKYRKAKKQSRRSK